MGAFLGTVGMKGVDASVGLKGHHGRRYRQLIGIWFGDLVDQIALSLEECPNADPRYAGVP